MYPSVCEMQEITVKEVLTFAHFDAGLVAAQEPCGSVSVARSS